MSIVKRHKYSLLLAEDDTSLRTTLSRLLLEKGFNVTEATNGKHAQQQIKSVMGEFDVIVTDLSMPGSSGLDLIRFVRKEFSEKNTIIFVLTGSDKKDDIVQAGRLKIAGYFIKPVKSSEMVIKILDALKTREQKLSA